MTPKLHVWTSILLDVLGEALSPTTCSACDARTRRHAVFCPTCAATIVRDVPSSRIEHPGGSSLEVSAFGAFGGALATAIRRLKYGGRADLSRPLGELLRRMVTDRRLRADLVVPVPLHPIRLRMRGYNQSALLGAAIARDVGAEFAPRALTRVRHGASQVGLPRNDRARAVAGAFVASRPLLGRSVVLVDDVVTTGVTLSACAHALYSAGGRCAGAVVLARTDLD